MMNGLILCGGQSSRLGFDKLNLLKDLIPIYQWWLNELKPYCNKVFISCNIDQKIKFNLPNCLLDEIQHKGPLSGIVQMIKMDFKQAILVAACDLCYITSDNIQYLVSERNILKHGTAIKNPETSQVFPLFAILEPQIFPSILVEFETGQQSLFSVLSRANVHILDKFINLKGINYPEDFRNYLESLEI
ncbi:MAG: molybdenum cofactor guanylyltransferase [Saprospiraceae bacterium]